jgi:membrane-associated HD superfamily phosphohydrolase
MATKKLTKLARIKKAFLDWSNTFTAQCYPKIFQKNTNKYLQLTWSLIFILFSGLTSLFVVLGIVDYLEFEVVTKIRIHTGKQIIFPIITLCNANPFTSKKSND